ncbi:hypothetical protein HaLaN_15355 [Haematococcus lacustris]|uniref:Uncharacterized protein n=1 Tax=Haematococcus lacustris TaxID=44745 RepID=A0A699ZRG6_HAELA|nr:hypothetical protein HaLaN_15355 [Haematococcus lacustris]
MTLHGHRRHVLLQLQPCTQGTHMVADVVAPGFRLLGQVLGCSVSQLLEAEALNTAALGFVWCSSTKRFTRLQLSSCCCACTMWREAKLGLHDCFCQDRNKTLDLNGLMHPAPRCEHTPLLTANILCFSGSMGLVSWKRGAGSSHLPSRKSAPFLHHGVKGTIKLGRGPGHVCRTSKKVNANHQSHRLLLLCHPGVCRFPWSPGSAAGGPDRSSQDLQRSTRGVLPDLHELGSLVLGPTYPPSAAHGGAA